MAAANPAKLETSGWRITLASTLGLCIMILGLHVQDCEPHDEIALFGRYSFVSNWALTVLSARGTWDELLHGGFKATECDACSRARIPPGRDTPSALNPQPVSQPCRPCLPCIPISQANGTPAKADGFGKLRIRTRIFGVPSRRIPEQHR